MTRPLPIPRQQHVPVTVLSQGLHTGPPALTAPLAFLSLLNEALPLLLLWEKSL